MKKSALILAFAICSIFGAEAQKKIPHAVRTINEVAARRTEIILPQVKGYNCYKADFHIHTSYSDGQVNPAGRVSEAWLDGLDIIAITDHYESRRGEREFLKVIAPYTESGEPMKYLPASSAKSIKADFNTIHKEAEAQIKKWGYPMLLIKGCEMARNAETHGHFNALFLKDINTVYDEDMGEAFRKVREQGGIVIHNHPAWSRKTSEKTEFHEAVYREGLISGVEVANGTTFYPHIVRRCVEEKLTMFGNTDSHEQTAHRFHSMGVFRTMTLIFAKELTEKAIKEAILKRRTIAYSGGSLIGEESWLVEFLNAAVECRFVKEDLKKETRTFVLTNTSSIPYRLLRGRTVYELEPFKSLQISIGKNKESGKYEPLKLTVENMWHIDYQHPIIEIEIDK